MKHELRTWRYLLKVAELGNVTRAAHELHMTQPALSRHLMNLEAEVGVKLLMRHGRGVRLTLAGLHFRDVASEVIERISALADELSATANIPSGELAVGLPMSWARLVTARLVPTFLRAYPEVRLLVTEGSTNELRRALKLRQLDVAVMLDGDPDGDLDQKRLVVEGAYVVGCEAEGFRSDKQVGLEVLSKGPLIMLPQETFLRSRIEAAFEQRGAQVNMLVQINSLSLFAFVEQGLGVTVLPESALVREPRRSELSYARIAALDLSWAIATLKARPRSAAVNAFALMTKSIVEDIVGAGDWQSATIVPG